MRGEVVIKHPNTVAAGTTGIAATLLVWLLNTLGIHLQPGLAAMVVTAGTSVVLFVGRRGIRGTAVAVWKGFR